MGAQRKLLIIDDDEETLEALRVYFRKKEFDVVAAPNGLEGLKILETDHEDFDLVLTDIVMPNVSGVGVISVVKKKYPHLATIAMTGWGEHPEALASEARADLVLKKPFELSQLETIIENLISRKRESTQE